MYKIKIIIDEGLNMDILSNETKQGIDLLETITQNFTVDDVVGHNLDEELYKDIVINYQGAVSDKTKERLAGQAVEEISGTGNAPEPAEEISGNPFIGDAYFKKNPDKILGEQSLGGRFGSSIMVSGDKDVVDVIDVPSIPKIFNKFNEEISTSGISQEKILEKVFDNYAKEKAAAPSRKPQQIGKQTREMITEEQADRPETYTFREVAEKSNEEISREELEAFLYADPSIPFKNYIDDFQYTKEDLIKNGFLYYHDGKFIYKWIYLSGDMNAKMTLLKRDEDVIRNMFGEKVFETQKNEILSCMPRQMDISRNDSDADTINIIPHSEFSRSFTLKGEDAVFILRDYKSRKNDEFTLFTLFLQYFLYLKEHERSAFLNADPSHVEDFLLRKAIKADRHAPKPADKTEEKIAKKQREEAKQKAKEIAEMLFRKMIYEELTSECKMRFKILWNERYNTTTLPDYKKIPVGFSISKFIGNQMLVLNKTQRESVAFINYIKSGCLALEVGLGKTIGALACISQAIENHYAKKPLVVVPKNVYYQWIKETSGKQARSLEKYVGALHHYPAIRELYNLNESRVYDEKEYTDAELNDIKMAMKNRKLVQEQNSEINKHNKVPDTLFSDENPLWKFAEKARNYALDSINNKIEALQKNYTEQLGKAQMSGNMDRYQKLERQLSNLIIELKNSYPKAFGRIYNNLVKEEYTYLIYMTGKFPEVPDGTITIITEDALKMNKLGTRDSDKVADRMYKILSQGDSMSDDDDGDYDERSGTKLMEKIKERVESRLGNAKVSIEDLGCDMLILDEAHHYRKIFTKLEGKVKTDESGSVQTRTSEGKGGVKTRKVEREDTNYKLDSGEPSGVALSAFFLSTYIQLTNPTGNVILLTATPFENNPLEIYSMLALANYAELEKAGFESMQDFFDTYMKVDYGYKIKINGVEKDTILNGYVNLVQLRTIIRNVILHRTGEQADIQRPEKVIIPYTNTGLLPENITEIKTNLVPTDDQMELIHNIDLFIEGDLSLTDLQSRDMERFLIEETLKEQEEIEKAQSEESGDGSEEPEYSETTPEPKEKKTKDIIDVTLQIESEEIATRIIQAISLKRQVSLSPYLLKTRRAANIDPTPEELVESSPKLKYIMTCIKTVKEHHEKNGTPISGQIIYSVIGKNFFPKFKQYLIDPKNGIGFKPTEIAIVAGGMSDNDKEDAKKGFNDGTIKVLIASKSIQVGANLHKKGTVLYHLFYDWNPTDNEQINGRIWRQGAEYAAVRIVYPMVENSVDPFIFQYLENKTNRIKDIWDMAGVKSQMDLSDFDPRKMKTEAMTDPVKRAKLEIEIIKDETLSEITLTENKLKELKDIPTAIKLFKESISKASTHISDFHFGMASFREEELTKEMIEKTGEVRDELETIQDPVKEIERTRDENVAEKRSLISELEDNIAEITTKLQAEQASLKLKIADAAVSDDPGILKELQDRYKSLPATAEVEKTGVNKEIGNINKEITMIEKIAGKKIKALGDLSEKISKLENKIVSIEESYTKKIEAVQEQAKSKNELVRDGSKHDSLKEYYTLLMRESTYVINYLKDPMAEGKRTKHMEHFYYSSQDIAVDLETFKNRKSEYERIKIKYLEPMGISDENAEQIVLSYQMKVEELRSKITDIEALYSDLVKKFTTEYYERLANAKTPEQCAMDFALLNWLLDERVQQVTAIEDAEIVPEAIDKEYLETKVEMFKMVRETEVDQETIEFLNTKIEMFKMVIESEPAIPTSSGSPDKNLRIAAITEPAYAFKEGGKIPGAKNNLTSYVDLVNEGLMTKEQFVTFMREKGYKIMPKSIYSEIKNVDSYDFMIKIFDYNNLI
ncbi:MAG: SNF2-related protein [Paludibacter sp.]|nr:SNF2-related protein [Paludibacter sp.]